MSVHPQIRWARALALVSALFLATGIGLGQRLDALDDAPRKLPVLEKHRHWQVVDLSPDGRFWIVWVRPKKYVAVFERASGKELKRWPVDEVGPNDIWFTPDPTRIVIQDTLLADLTVKTSIFNVEQGTTSNPCKTARRSYLKPLRPLRDDVVLGFRRDTLGEWGSANAGTLLKTALRNCSTQASIRLTYVVNEIAVNPDLSLMAHTGEGIWLRDLETLDGRVHIPDEPGWSFEDIEFSRDGRTLAVRAERAGRKHGDPQTFRVLVHDVTTGKLLRSLDIPRACRGLAIAPNSSLLATSCWEERKRLGRKSARGIVSLYDYHSGEELAYAILPWEKLGPMGISGVVHSILFTPDGKQIMADTYSTRVWTIPNELVRGPDGGAQCATCAHTTAP